MSARLADREAQVAGGRQAGHPRQPAIISPRPRLIAPRLRPGALCAQFIQSNCFIGKHHEIEPNQNGGKDKSNAAIR
jgi:hypothetical protein